MSEEDTSNPATEGSTHFSLIDWRFTYFLSALIFLFFVYLPLTPPLPIEPFDLIVYALLLSATYAVSARRRSFFTAVVLAVPSFLLISAVNPADPRSTLATLNYFSFITITTVGCGDVVWMAYADPSQSDGIVLEGMMKGTFHQKLEDDLVSLGLT